MADHKKDPTLVMKFGGSSVGNPDAIDQSTEIVLRTLKDWPRLVVVLSAMSGITDILLKSARQAVKGEMVDVLNQAAKIQKVHFDVIDLLIPDSYRQNVVRQEIDHLISEFINLCQAISVIGEATPRALDAIASLGEKLSIRIFSQVLQAKSCNAQPVDATQIIVTDRQFQSAVPDMAATKKKTLQVLEPLLAQGAVPVVTGFIAATPEGITTTLGRGGSDYSAAILGAALHAEDVWIWTDVDGVMTADPRMVPEAHTIEKLSFREIAELAYFGAKVVHPKTMRPVIEAGISIRVCNTFNPDHAGTQLTPDQIVKGNGVIKAVTAIQMQSLVTIEGRGMLGVPGVAARAFGAVAATGTSVPLITQASSEQSICFAVPLDSSEIVIQALETAFSNELARRDIDRIWATGDVVIITIVGAGIQHTPGVAGKIFGKLGENLVNVIAIAQGSSEVSISIVVDKADAEKAVQVLHELTKPPAKS